jgi:predicted Ser/Thr protein kinase
MSTFSLNLFTPVSKKSGTDKQLITQPQTNQLSLAESSHLSGPMQDMVQISGKKSREEELREASRYVDDVLESCDHQPVIERMTLRDFLINTKLEPKRFLPTASSYTLDAFGHFEGSEGPRKIRVYGETMPHYRLMDAPWNNHLMDPVRVYGQEPTVNRVLEIIRAFKQQPNADRGIAFFGPHGSGKSLIPKTIMAGLEHFSQQDAGSLWTYSFVFPDGQTVKPQSREEAEIWAREVSESGSKLLEPEKIAAQLMANLNLNPIFLLPPKQRVQFIQGMREEGKIPPDFNVDYYLKSNLDGHAQRVLDKLHQLYSENPSRFQKTLEHVQVERWTLSALVEVPASRNPDAVLRETADSSTLEKLPELVRSVGKRTLDGLMPRAHRGIFYMDDFGRSGRSNDHLLMPLETGEVTMQEVGGGPGITKELLDFIPMLSVNPEVLEKARKEGNFDALEQRLLFVPVPCERRFKVEAQILEPILNKAKARGKTIIPGTLDAFSQWVILTRMFPVDKDYGPYKELAKENRDFASGLRKLTPLGKALLYQGEQVPGLTLDEQQALDENLKVIANEHTQSLGETEFTLYEGGVGLTNRSAMNILKSIAARPGNEPISFIDIFEAIAHYAQNKPQYEAKRKEILEEREADLEFPSGLELLKEVEDYTREKFMGQLKDALGMYQDPAVYAEQIQKYFNHIEALRDGKSVAPKYQVDADPKPDMAFITSFETIISGKRLTDSQRKEFRSKFLTQAFNWQSTQSDFDNVNRIYKDEVERLRQKDEEQNKEYLTEFRNNVKILLKTPRAFESQKGLPATQRLEKAITKLGQLGYTAEALPRILDWALDGRYIADQVKVR